MERQKYVHVNVTLCKHRCCPKTETHSAASAFLFLGFFVTNDLELENSVYFCCSKKQGCQHELQFSKEMY